MILLNPKKYAREFPDDITKEIMLKTIEFFENKGKEKLKEDDHGRVWYADFLEFVKENKIFATLLTPGKYTDGETRWDTHRNSAFSEILGFYGLCYWYTWQVTILGLGPIWMSANEKAKKKAARLLQEGEVFAFGLSEKEHGADVYSTDMKLTPSGDGTYTANGCKYYIGNGDVARMVSNFGKMTDRDDFVFFVSDSQADRHLVIKNVCATQNHVAEYELVDYPVKEEDILHLGKESFHTALNTVNVGKFNLGWASIGICTHAMYEAINHASNRNLYGMWVTDFPHVKQMFTDAYTRLVAMKLYALRASDYMRVASKEDRRYILYSTINKMKVTTQGEQVVSLLMDVIAAKGFEKDTYFEMAARDIIALPRLEGTVHVNIALVVKFIFSTFFKPGEFPDIGEINENRDDDFLWTQGPSKGLGEVQFHDYQKAFELFDLPNVNLFFEQVEIFKQFLMEATPNDEQQKDTDFLMSLGNLFTQVVYSQLVLESAKIQKIEREVVDQIFDFMVRDFSQYALQLHGKQGSTETQQDFCIKMIRKPIVDKKRYDNVWQNHVYALKDIYEMNE